MYVTRQSRSALARIHAAIQAGLGYAYNAGDAGAGGGGGGDNPPANTTTEPRKKEKKSPASDPDTLTMTVAERDKLVADAIAEQERKAADKAAKETAEREAEEAKKRGEFEKLAEKEKTRADSEQSRADAAELKLALHNHIAEHKPEFLKAASLIGKLIDREAAKADADKAIKAAIAEYEGTLPEKPKGSVAAPTSQPRQSVRGMSPAPQNNERPARRFSTLNYRV